MRQGRYPQGRDNGLPVFLIRQRLLSDYIYGTLSFSLGQKDSKLFFPTSSGIPRFSENIADFDKMLFSGRNLYPKPINCFDVSGIPPYIFQKFGNYSDSASAMETQSAGLHGAERAFPPTHGSVALQDR